MSSFASPPAPLPVHVQVPAMSSFASSPLLSSIASPPASLSLRVPVDVPVPAPSPYNFPHDFPLEGFPIGSSSSSFPFENSSSGSSSSSLTAGHIAGIVVGVIFFLFVSAIILRYAKLRKKKPANAIENDEDSRFISLAMVQFLEDMERERPIRFTSQQLRLATNKFNTKLGSGGFGIVYKGTIGNNPVAVKVLKETSNERLEEQFMAEVSTMGRTHHFNLVRLYGFCFESSLIALVYEYMVNGSLDNHLFEPNNKVSMLRFDNLHEIAVGTARGIAYLHEDCAQRIVHYDIKPGNILLDSNFCAKVADFGLAKLCNRDITHITMTQVRGTPGYAAPELWMPLRVTYKCDVYSFGMLLFEIIGRRRNMDIIVGDNQRWFPICVWDKYEKNQLKDLMIECEIEEKNHEVLERMLKVGFCCVQYRPETRPMMSTVVKMLEGALEVPEPLNPFTYLFSGANEPNGSLVRMALNIDISSY